MSAYSIIMLSWCHLLLETVRRLVYECFLVTNDVPMVNARQYSDFVKGVLFLLVRKVAQLDLLQCVLNAISQPLDFEDTRIGSFAQPGHNLKILERHP